MIKINMIILTNKQQILPTTILKLTSSKNLQIELQATVPCCSQNDKYYCDF